MDISNIADFIFTNEVFFVMSLIVGMLGSGIWVGILSGYWHLLWVFVTFFLCFGLVEWHAVKTTGLSVSQQMWALSESHPTQFWIIIGLLAFSWLSLMIHFASKKLGKRE